MEAILTSSRFAYRVTSTFFVQRSLVAAGMWNTRDSRRYNCGISGELMRGLALARLLAGRTAINRPAYGVSLAVSNQHQNFGELITWLGR